MSRVWTKLQSSPRRPAHLPPPRQSINWAVRTPRGTACSSLTSTSCRCVFVATCVESARGRGELLETLWDFDSLSLDCQGLLLPCAYSTRLFPKNRPQARLQVSPNHRSLGWRANSAWQTKLRAANNTVLSMVELSTFTRVLYTFEVFVAIA